jgi:hydroxyacylglutathione hydrolase
MTSSYTPTTVQEVACGKNMRNEKTDTLGNQKKTNYALNPELSKEEFIEELLEGLTAPPAYFTKNVLINIQEYESLDTAIERASRPLSPEAFELVANETQALVLDTSDAEEFAKGFVPNSINIGLEGNFGMWVGEMIKDIKQEILLVTKKGEEEEAMIRLSRVGYDRTIGFLEGGFGAWKESGKEVDSLERLSPKQFATQYDEEPLVFEVRKKSEFDSEHLVDAINIPLNQINEHLAEFPKDKPFMVHCAAGYRSMSQHLYSSNEAGTTS